MLAFFSVFFNVYLYPVSDVSIVVLLPVSVFRVLAISSAGLEIFSVLAFYQCVFFFRVLAIFSVGLGLSLL